MRTPFRPLRAAPALSGLLFLALAACNSQPENIVVGPRDDMEEQLAHAKPVELPPSISATKTFRCKDNSVVYVDFYSDGKSAGLHQKKDGAPTMVKAPAAGEPMVADGGYALTGTATAATVSVTLPGKPKQDCDSN
ncbi:hypothetical protein [Sphingomonas sp. PR090111-T3T-6A]|uniref:hypothetical protein n=1 Tax=Sphingomonas sp. PR090111-T3T-6A TaxID=685778 RepID=UPI00035C2C0D|nr:hypothetical protein [Sphingomonas sp. PR090111-T3T-6A]